jgi:hypothetical protein
VARLLFFLLLLPSLSFAQVQHTVNWDQGVYKKSINRWVRALGEFADVSSITYITKQSGGKDELHIKGHRDLAVWIPKTVKADQGLTVVVWFHGHWGFSYRTFAQRILRQFSPKATEGKQFIVAIPEMPWSVNTKTPRGRNGQIWQLPGDFLNFIDQVKSVLLNHQAIRGKGLGKINWKVVGHSAGGSTIKRLGITGDLCKLNPSMVVWSDSSYGKWLDDAWDGCLNNANIPTEVFVRKWGPTWRSAIRFMGEFQGQPKFLHLHVKKSPWTHKKIGDNIVKESGILE